jgi:hypothetical protein
MWLSWIFLWALWVIATGVGDMLGRIEGIVVGVVTGLALVLLLLNTEKAAKGELGHWAAPAR